jgi:hypothetical protein
MMFSHSMAQCDVALRLMVTAAHHNLASHMTVSQSTASHSTGPHHAPHHTTPPVPCSPLALDIPPCTPPPNTPTAPPQAYPLDLVRTRLAAQTQGHYYSGIGSTLRCIVADEGVAGLYRGLGATLLQVWVGGWVGWGGVGWGGVGWGGVGWVG